MIRRVTAVVVAAFALAALAIPASAADWPGYLHDTQGTSYQASESTITPATAPNLKVDWTATAGGAAYPQPAVVGGVAYWGSWDGYEHATDVSTGSQLWKTNLGQLTDTSCNPPTVGVASSATVQTVSINGVATKVVYVGGGNANLYALNASTGAVIWKKSLGALPSHFIWDSPMYANGQIYIGVSSFGDCPLVRGRVFELNPATGSTTHSAYINVAGCNGGGVWGSIVTDPATGDIYFGTGNPPGSTSCANPLDTAVVQMGKNLNLIGSWQIPSAQHGPDSDFGSTPTIFQDGSTTMVGIDNKNGVFYAFKAASVGSGWVWKVKVSNGGPCPECGRADISPAAWDGSHLYIASENTTVGSTKCAGAIGQVDPATGKFTWQDCIQSGPVLGAVTAVPGVVFAGAGNTYYAFNASTGAQLFAYTDSVSGSNFWGAGSVSNGQVFIGNQDGVMTALGT